MEVDGDNVLHISAEHKDEKEEGEKVTHTQQSFRACLVWETTHS